MPSDGTLCVWRRADDSNASVNDAALLSKQPPDLPNSLSLYAIHGGRTTRTPAHDAASFSRRAPRLGASSSAFSMNHRCGASSQYGAAGRNRTCTLRFRRPSRVPSRRGSVIDKLVLSVGLAPTVASDFCIRILPLLWRDTLVLPVGLEPTITSL